MVPVYRSTTSLVELAGRIKKVFAEVVGADYELIFVDDGSPNPETWPTLEKLARDDDKVRAVQLTRNFGQHPATLRGLSRARGRWVLTMDDDLQHRPEDIPLLLAARDHDIVIAQFTDKKHSAFKRLTSRIKGWFDHKLIGKPRDLHLTSFRLLARPVVDGMMEARSPYPFLPALMFYVSRDCVGVPTSHDPRFAGDSGYTLRKMIRMFSNLLINNSSFLLRMIGTVGIWISLLAFATGAYFIGRKVIYDLGVPGWTSVIVSVLFMGGLLLFSVGVIGEYLIRIIDSVDRKPMSFVRRELGFDEAAASEAEAERPKLSVR